jgi:hypothetical protein
VARFGFAEARQLLTFELHHSQEERIIFVDALPEILLVGGY